ncbi:MAG: hypothetical protein ACK4YQ_15170 [Phenylobacterium sp.]|uniref:hypothetical protein n=1 Tax=Phenylobacterium sp. TaxID=1871053 RepID=UPI0039192D37
MAPAGGQSGATPPGRLQALQAELAELESRQSSLPVRDFLHASFTLKEQITTERVAAGEDLDVIGVQFAGQVYRLGGRFLGGLSELAETGEVRTVQLARPRGVLA